MANIGNLIVNVVARTSAFEKGMSKSRKQLKQFEQATRAAQRTTRLLTSALSAVGVGLGVSRMVQSMRATANAIDDVNKSAERLNVPIEKLQSLRLATELDNVGPEETDRALLKLTRTISDAADGNKEAIRTFQQLGIETKELAKLNRMDAVQQFTRLAAGLEGVKTHGDKVRLTMAALGRQGATLLPTLSLGARGLKQVEAQAKSLGIVVNKETAAAIDNLNDQLTILGKAFEGAKTQILIDITPAATEGIKALAETTSGATRFNWGKMLKNEWPASLLGPIWDDMAQAIKSRTEQYIRDYTLPDMTNQRDYSKLFIKPMSPWDQRVNAAMSATETGLARVRGIRNSVSVNALSFLGGGIKDKLAQLGEVAAEKATTALEKYAAAVDQATKWAEEQQKRRNSVSGLLERFGTWWGMPAFKARLDAQRKLSDEEQRKGQTSAATNRALLKGTLEAYVAQRANMLPKQALEEAKKQTALLAKIERKTGGGSGSSVTLTAVGIT